MMELYLLDVSPLSDPALMDAALASLSATRRAKAERMRPPEGKRLSAGAGLALSYALGRRGLDERTVTYAAGPQGKPYLADRPEIAFSLSHAGHYVLLAVGEGAVGCDIEEIRPENPAIPRRFFTPEEADAIAAAPDPDDAFFTLWTRKESVLKALGTGLSTPLNAFTVGLPGEAPAFASETLTAPGTLVDLPAPEGYRAALCAPGVDAYSLRCLTLRLEEGRVTIAAQPLKETL